MRRWRMVLCAAGSAVLLQATGLQAELPPLIPREVLFGNPDKRFPMISPDGTRLAYVAPADGVLNVWVRTVGEHDDRPVTHDRNRGIKHYFWAQDNEHILFIRDKDGDENWHIYAVDLKADEKRDLTPFEGVHARVIATEQRFPNEILVAINKRNRQLHDVYRANLSTGKLTLEARNDRGFIGWVPDHDFRVRGAMAMTPDGGTALEVREKVGGPWRTLVRWGPADALTSGPIGFTPDGAGLYIISSAGSNTGQLRRIDLADGKETLLAADDRADVADLFVHPVHKSIQAVAFYRERNHWKVLDESVAEDFAAIRRIRRGDFGINNRDHADRTWLVYITADDGPIHYYAYDRVTKKAEFLFTNRKSLEDVRLARREPIEFKARDGLAIHGYLTTPPGIPASNLPMVLHVHGGPYSRNKWGYCGETQWLANRGYAVLQVNFRGSTGYGKKFLNAGNREWGGKMQDDLLDGVAWAVKRGVADPKRIGIFGGSYGGYATLMGLAATPEKFACGVDIVGPSNLVTWMKTIPPYWKPLEPLLWDRVGHPVKDAEFLKSRSPLFMVDRITKPLLIAQGTNDPRVKKEESQQIVEALKLAGKVVEYVEYPDEGHGFARPENRLDFYARTEKFLAKHLGGRSEDLQATPPPDTGQKQYD